MPIYAFIFCFQIFLDFFFFKINKKFILLYIYIFLDKIYEEETGPSYMQVSYFFFSFKVKMQIYTVTSVTIYFSIFRTRNLIKIYRMPNMPDVKMKD